jgi:hypothetical protein
MRKIALKFGFWTLAIFGWSPSFFIALNGQALRITEINYNSDSTISTGDWFELYNPGSSALDLSGYKIKDADVLNLYIVPPGTSIAPGGYLVFVADTQRFNSQYSIPNKVGPLGFGLNNNTDQIQVFDPSNQLIIQVTYSDSTPWNMGADGLGRTLELLNPSADPNDPNSWRIGCILGSPGQAYQPCVAETLIVSEVNYKSPPGNDAGDWFELRNLGNTPRDVSGFFVRDEKNTNLYKIPPGTIIAPDGFLVLFADLTLFNQENPGIPNKVGPISFSLSGTGDAIRIYNASDKLIYSMHYLDYAPWPNEPDGNGYTLEAPRNPLPDWDVNSAAYWGFGCLGGSPGYLVPENCLMGFLESESVLQPFSPNPATHYIVLHEAFAQVEILDPNGRICVQHFDSPEGLRLDVENLAKGLYLLKMQSHAGKVSCQRVMLLPQ